MKPRPFLAGSIIISTLLASSVTPHLMQLANERNRLTEEEMFARKSAEKRSEELARKFEIFKMEKKCKERIIDDLLAHRITFYEAIDAFRVFEHSEFSLAQSNIPGCDSGEDLAYYLVIFRLLAHVNDGDEEWMTTVAEIRRRY